MVTGVAVAGVVVIARACFIERIVTCFWVDAVAGRVFENTDEAGDGKQADEDDFDDD